MTYPVQHVSQSIECPPSDVIAFAGDPANLPLWAAGLSTGIREDEGRWIADSPMGSVEVRFAEAGELGILDHDVHLPDGTVVHNPLRVLPNGEGSEIVFTLFRTPGVSAEDFARDAAAVREDLDRLRTILESEVSADS